jgi:hypothetical protein
MSPSKKSTYKGTLRQVFIRVYRLEIANFFFEHSVMLVFSTQLWDLYSSVLHSVLDKIQNLQYCYTTPNNNLGGEGISGQINTCRKVPLQVNCSDYDILTTFCFGVCIVNWSVVTGLLISSLTSTNLFWHSHSFLCEWPRSEHPFKPPAPPPTPMCLGSEPGQALSIPPHVTCHNTIFKNQATIRFSPSSTVPCHCTL